MDLHVTNEKELSEKVKNFQAKCSNLEGVINKLRANSDNTKNDLQNIQEDHKKLIREKLYLEDKNRNLEKSYNELK
jgi:peptidoglycan hydrolase CwlO-like protein